jgi:regulator of sigma E protease
VAIVPLGGYVKMYGDANAASTPGDGLDAMTAAERAVSFHHKTLAQRAAIIVAGPAANFLFAIVVFVFLFAARGQPFTPPQAGQTKPSGHRLAAR